MSALGALPAQRILKIVARSERYHACRKDRRSRFHCDAESAGFGVLGESCVCGGVLLTLSVRALTASIGSSPASERT